MGAALITGGVPSIFFEKPLVADNGQANVSDHDFVDAAAMLVAADTAGIETAMMFNYVSSIMSGAPSRSRPSATSGGPSISNSPRTSTA